MKKIVVFILTSLFSNILSMEVDSNIDQDNIESSIFYLQSEIALPISPELKSYVNQIKSANNIFEFYKFFDQEKNTELSNMRLNDKLFNRIISDIYLKIIHDKFEELKTKAVLDYKDKSKEDLNKELQDILKQGIFLGEEKLRECCKLILAGADVDLKSRSITTLIIAVRKGYIELVKLLLDKNADTDLEDITSYTALMHASDKGDIAIVKLLLDKNTNIDIQNVLGWTALMVAVNNGYIEIVKLLLYKNAKTDIQNKRGQIASIMAENKGYNEIADLLRNKSS